LKTIASLLLLLPSFSFANTGQDLTNQPVGFMVLAIFVDNLCNFVDK